jgi:hypothetical protein
MAEMINHQIYLIRTREFKNSNKPIYKIGKTMHKDVKKRLRQYGKGYEIFLVKEVKDCHIMEKRVIELFNRKYNCEKEYGREYYSGNVDDMIKDIGMLCCEPFSELETKCKEERLQKTILPEELLVKSITYALPSWYDYQYFDESWEWKRIGKPILIYLILRRAFGFFQRTPEFVSLYKNRCLIYLNICRVVQGELDKPIETISPEGLEQSKKSVQQNNIYRRKLGYDLLIELGFSGLLDTNTVTIPEVGKLSKFISRNMRDICHRFNKNKTLILDYNKDLIKFINRILKNVYGIVIEEYTTGNFRIAGMDIWSTEKDENYNKKDLNCNTIKKPSIFRSIHSIRGIVSMEFELSRKYLEYSSFYDEHSEDSDDDDPYFENSDNDMGDEICMGYEQILYNRGDLIYQDLFGH